MEGLFSIKSNVYSFGILMLEIVSGKKNSGFYHLERAQSLLLYAWRLWNEGKGMEFIDQTIVDICPISEALRLIHIALLPTMSMVILMLASKSIKLPQPLAPPFSVAKFIMFDQSSSNEMGIRFITPVQSSTMFSLTTSVHFQPTYNYHFCLDHSNETSNTYYQSNLTVLLESLSSKASQNYSFYNESSNIGIYALFLCRGDVSKSTCQTCVSYAIRDITTQCPSNKSAIIWYDQCMLRYSDVSFFGQAKVSPMLLMWNTQNTSSPDLINAKALSLMYDLIDSATTKGVLFNSNNQTDGSEKGYGLVQCTRDIDNHSCYKCLIELINKAQNCCQAKIGWRILGASCFLRYEKYSFTENSSAIPSPSPSPTPTSLLPPPPPPPQSVPAEPQPPTTTKVVIITISSIASIAVVAALLGFWFYTSYGRRKREGERETSEETPLQNYFPNSISVHLIDSAMHAKACEDSGEMQYFNLSTIHIATNNFFDVNKLGEGGFGPVYKGKLINGKEIAVKRLSLKSKQGLEEFKNEVILIAKLQHRNLVRLLGCCLEGEEKLLVYEYMANTSLDAFLFDPKKCNELDWAKRTNIVNGIAKGLQYLHEDSWLKIIHRDMKASNILLDNEMNPKILDFGNQIEANTNRISDVYSFGILMLEIVSGKKNNSFYHQEHAQSLLLYAWRLWNEGKGMEFMDQTIVDICPISEALRLIHIALLCVQEDPNDRPTMSEVILMLASTSIKLPQALAPPFSVARFIMSDQSSTNEMGIGFITSDQSSASASS
ncbi:hypothetical protein ACB094_05G186800 [Castanea mollissima]